MTATKLIAKGKHEVGLELDLLWHDQCSVCTVDTITLQTFFDCSIFFVASVLDRSFQIGQYNHPQDATLGMVGKLQLALFIIFIVIQGMC